MTALTLFLLASLSSIRSNTLFPHRRHHRMQAKMIALYTNSVQQKREIQKKDKSEDRQKSRLSKVRIVNNEHMGKRGIIK